MGLKGPFECGLLSPSLAPHPFMRNQTYQIFQEAVKIAK